MVTATQQYRGDLRDIRISVERSISDVTPLIVVYRIMWTKLGKIHVLFEFLL